MGSEDCFYFLAEEIEKRMGGENKEMLYLSFGNRSPRSAGRWI